MIRKYAVLALSMALACTLLAGCAPVGLPITDDEPAVTLPPAEVSYLAPIGDASLEYTAPATLYLPRHDGMGLTTVESEVSFSPTRSDAESLARALLAHAGDGNASPVGGSVRLSLYGVNPVEVSRNVATVNLAANALQLSRDALYLACQAIANTLTTMPEIEWVNFLVVDRPVGLDIANTLPMGAFSATTAQDIGAAYEQLLSRRVDSGSDASLKPLTSNVTLYFPVSGMDGVVSEVRSVSFSDQVFSNMVVAILRELAQGPTGEIDSPALPLLGDLLTADPVLVNSESTGGSVIELEFAYNLDDMLEAYGLTRAQSMASLCYTLCTFFPNVSGIRVSINDTPVSQLQLEEDQDVSISFAENVLLRTDFSTLLYDYCTLYFADTDGQHLREVRRPVPYTQRMSPRTLLIELARGPKAYDSVEGLTAVMPAGAIQDTDILGLALSEGAMLVNFAPSFENVGAGMDETQERLLVYAMVNTLCAGTKADSVCFFRGGAQFDGFSGKIYWRGLFYPLPADS